MKGSEAKKPKGQDKENYLEPDRIEDYYTPITATERKDNLSSKDVQDKLHVYSRAVNDMVQYFAIQKLIKEREREIHTLNDNRIKQDINYAAGERLRLQQASHEVIKEDRNWIEQDKNHDVLKEGKEKYDKNGLKKTFTPDKATEKDQLREIYNRVIKTKQEKEHNRRTFTAPHPDKNRLKEAFERITHTDPYGKSKLQEAFKEAADKETLDKNLLKETFERAIANDNKEPAKQGKGIAFKENQKDISTPEKYNVKHEPKMNKIIDMDRDR